MANRSRVRKMRLRSSGIVKMTRIFSHMAGPSLQDHWWIGLRPCFPREPALGNHRRLASKRKGGTLLPRLQWHHCSIRRLLLLLGWFSRGGTGGLLLFLDQGPLRQHGNLATGLLDLLPGRSAEAMG